MEEKTFIESKKWLAFIVSLVIIAASYFIGFKLAMTQAMLDAMTFKMMVVSLSLILGQAGVDLAKTITQLLSVVKTLPEEKK
jgi:hypothetical protein